MKKRVYTSVNEMNGVAKSQWRELARVELDNYLDIVSNDKSLWEYASSTVDGMDEDGKYDGLTIEMESWAMGTTDGIDTEIDIINKPTGLTMDQVVEIKKWWEAFESLPSSDDLVEMVGRIINMEYNGEHLDWVALDRKEDK